MKKIIIKFYKLLYSFRCELLLWFEFIKSIKFNKNPILIFNYEKWHYQIDYKFRKKDYIKFFKNKSYNVICVNLSSRYFVIILNIFLNIHSFKLFKNKPIKRFYSKKFLSSYNYAYWDLNIRNENFFINNKISTDRKKYRKLFQDFSNKPQNLNHWERISNIFSNKKVKGLILTQQAYEELPLARFALDNNLQIIYFESTNGIELINPSNESLMDLSSKIFDKGVKTLKEKELEEQKLIIEDRILGKEEKSERIFLKNLERDVKNKNDINFKSEENKTLCLYLHCFADSPNWNRDTDEYSPFIDFYEMSLYVLEYCAVNKIPILIKPHPESDSYFNDKYYLDKLYQKTLEYKESHNLSIQWVGRDFVNYNLTKINNPVVVTGRGTVISECGYLGIPSISFCKSPWQNLNNLSFLVETTNDFKKIFPNINNFFLPRSSKREALILSAMLERGMKRMTFKLARGSKTIKKRNSIDDSWVLRQEV